MLRFAPIFTIVFRSRTWRNRRSFSIDWKGIAEFRRKGIRGQPAKRGEAIRSIARNLGVVLALLVLAGAVGSVALSIATRPGASIGSGAFFTVEKGDNAQTIAEALFQKGYIKSALVFKFLARVEGLGSSLQAGTYRIESGMGSKQILDELAVGRQALIRVTVPEGFTLTQIGALLEQLGVVTKASFLQAGTSPALLLELGIPAHSAEGYLFPNTYFFPIGYEAEGIVRTMVKSLRERLATIPNPRSYRRRSSMTV